MAASDWFLIIISVVAVSALAIADLMLRRRTRKIERLIEVERERQELLMRSAHSGLTKREYFFAIVLAGLCAKCSVSQGPHRTQVIEDALAVADAAIARLNG